VLLTSNTLAEDLWEVCAYLKNKKFVDLTHTFYPGIPHWPGFPDEKIETIYWYERGVGSVGSGFFATRYCLVGQWGTHVDAPAHFFPNKKTIDKISVKEMIMPLVVIDVHKKVKLNPDYVLNLNDIKMWERKYGTIPNEAFVVMRTDWSKRWPNTKAMQNEDENGIAHYPGWSIKVLKFLFEKRKISAIGHETTDTDPGINTSKGVYECEAYVLSTNHFQIELLTNLDKVPEKGAIAIVTFPKPERGAGFPARVFAILP